MPGSQETTTKLFSSFYQDLFANLIAANSKTSAKPSPATPAPPPSGIVTADAEIEIFVDSKEDDHDHDHHDQDHFEQLAKSRKSIPPAPIGNLGLSVTSSGLDSSTKRFVDINNELGLRLYRQLVEQHPEDNLVFCPVSASSALAMISLGARGETSWDINKLLELDSMITFNPHLLYKNITDTLTFQSDKFHSSSSKHVLLSDVSLIKVTFDKLTYIYIHLITYISGCDFSN